MYQIELETPRGILRFNIENIKELNKLLEEHPDYSGVKAKQIKKEIKKWLWKKWITLFKK